jgi:anti-sigma factor RsiW
MNAELECERTLLVQADFDGELDAAQAAALIEHERQCAHCQRVRGQLERSRQLLRAAPRYAAPDELHDAIARGLQGANEAAQWATERNGVGARARARAADEAMREMRMAAQSARGAESEAPSPQSARGARSEAASAQLPRDSQSARESPESLRDQRRASPARQTPLGWISALAAAMALVIVVLLPRSPDVGTQLVANHVRAMQLESHLIDVVSSDHHTVKPWFAGKVPFAPLVKQLDSDGYVLKGGRVDIVNGSPAAVLVYQVGRHIVDVYMWPATSGTIPLRTSSQVEGFNLRHWQESGLTVWCISDMSADELDRFAQRWRQGGSSR